MGRPIKYHRKMSDKERQRKKRGQEIFQLRKHSGGILPDSGRAYECPPPGLPPWLALAYTL